MAEAASGGRLQTLTDVSERLWSTGNVVEIVEPSGAVRLRLLGSQASCSVCRQCRRPSGCCPPLCVPICVFSAPNPGGSPVAARGLLGGQRDVLGQKSFIPPVQCSLPPEATSPSSSLPSSLCSEALGSETGPRAGQASPALCSPSYLQRPEPARPEATFPGPVSFLLPEGRRKQSQEQGECDGDSPGWRRPPLPLPRTWRVRVGGQAADTRGLTEPGPREREAGSDLRWK